MLCSQHFNTSNSTGVKFKPRKYYKQLVSIFSGHICHQSPENFGQRFPNFFGVLVSSFSGADRSRQVGGKIVPELNKFDLIQVLRNRHCQYFQPKNALQKFAKKSVGCGKIRHYQFKFQRKTGFWRKQHFSVN